MSLGKKKKKPLKATLEIKIPESFSFAVDYITKRGEGWFGCHVETDLKLPWWVPQGTAEQMNHQL